LLYILQDHYDDERDKTVFHKTTADLQDQDRLFWSETGLVLSILLQEVEREIGS